MGSATKHLFTFVKIYTYPLIVYKSHMVLPGFQTTPYLKVLDKILIVFHEESSDPVNPGKSYKCIYIGNDYIFCLKLLRSMVHWLSSLLTCLATLKSLGSPLILCTACEENVTRPESKSFSLNVILKKQIDLLIR